MTIRRSHTKSEDVLWTNIARTSGGLYGLTEFLNDRSCRENLMTEKAVRKMFDGQEGRSPSIKQMRLATEWMLSEGSQNATAHISVLAAEFDMTTTQLPPEPVGGWSCESTALSIKTLTLTQQLGELSKSVMDATDDKTISEAERDEVIAKAMQMQEILGRLVRNVKRAADKGRK